MTGTTSKIWEKIQALMNWLEEMSSDQREFVENCFTNLDPNNPYSELTERQVKWIDWLYAKHELGEEEPEW